LKDSIG